MPDPQRSKVAASGGPNPSPAPQAGKSSPRAFNPFYAALLIAGVAFAVTAICYGVMAFRELRGLVPPPEQGGLMAWMSEHGQWLLGVELAALMGLSLAAMLTDPFWERRADRTSRGAQGSKRSPDPPHSSAQHAQADATDTQIIPPGMGESP